MMDRVIITFKDKKIHADIENDVLLSEALSEIMKVVKRIESGDYDVINDIDSDMPTINIDEFLKKVH